MNISLPDELAPILGDDERAVLTELLVWLYKTGRISLGYAASVLDVDRLDFQRILKERGQPLNYSVQDLEDDLRGAEWLSNR